MFEDWSTVIGGIMETAGLPGFLENIEDFYERADTEGTVWRSFVSAWWQKHGESSVGVGDLFELVSNGHFGLNLGTGTERSQRTALGLLLKSQRDRCFQVDAGSRTVTCKVTLGGKKRGANQWSLETQAGAQPDREIIEV
jgi:hypothetical protein